MAKTWKKADLDEIKRLRQTGHSWVDVGRAFGVAGDTARMALKYHDGRQKTNGPAFDDYDWPEEINWREWLDRAEEINQLHARLDPINTSLTVDLRNVARPIAIAFAADLHLGGGFTNHRLVRETMEWIMARDDMYLGLCGDGIEGFLPGFRSAEAVEQQALSVKAQMAAYKDLCFELVDRNTLLFATWGDHDAVWLEKALGFNVMKWKLHDRVPYFSGRGLIRLRLGRQTYYLLVNHREPYASQWNKNHPPRRAYERWFPAHTVVTAHTHSPAWQVFHHYEQLKDANVGLGGKVALVVAGTFKSGPDVFSIRGWERGIFGVPTVIYWPDVQDLEVYSSPQRAAQVLDQLT